MRIFGRPRRFAETFGLLSGGAAATYASTLAEINPLLWGKFNEASGNLINYGSLGVGLNGVASGTVTYAQTGLRGAGEAYLFPSIDALIVIPQTAAMNGMASFTCWFLVYLNGAGGTSTGTFVDKTSSILWRLGGATRTIQAVVNYTGGGSVNAQSITSTTLSLGQWYTLALTIDDAEKYCRIWINGVQASYGTFTQGVGTRVSNTNAVNLANNGPLARHFDGYFDEFLVKDSVLTPTTLLQLDTLARAA